MGLVKCPRCELNYILDGGSLCTVCRKEVRGESEQDDITELCSECGENPAVPGGELCASCLKEIARRMTDGTDDDDVIVPEEASLEIDSVSTMDEIAIDIDDPLDDEAMAADPDFKDDDEEEDEEDEDLNLKDNHDDLLSR
ncbi:MAG: hypothetical protein RR893_05110 [Clostridia bacterium]